VLQVEHDLKELAGKLAVSSDSLIEAKRKQESMEAELYKM